MTKANDLASLLDANGDVVSSALDNVPASDLVNDTTPQLGGNLDLNSNNITGTGNIDVTGTVTADGLTVDTNTLYVDSTNNRVGVGTTNTSVFNAFAADVIIGGGTTNAGITVYSGSASTGNINFADGTTGYDLYQGYINYDHPNNRMGFYVNYAGSGSPRMSIDSSGNLLVGTTNTDPAFNNVTGQSMASTGQLQVTRDGGTAALFNRKTSDGEIVSFRKDGGTVGSIGSASSGGVFDISGAANDVRITGGNASYWLDNSAVYAGNNASRDLGTSSFAWRDLYLSGGVLLGGVGSANYLDDYEEGTWTPQLWKGATQVTSPSSTGGKYIKIGDMLYINWYIYKSSGTNTASGNWLIKGIPFTLSPSNPYTSVPVTYFTLNNVNQFDVSPHRMQVNGTNYLEMYSAQASTNWNSGIVELGGSGVIRLT